MGKFASNIPMKPFKFHDETITADLVPIKRKDFVKALAPLTRMASLKEELGPDADKKAKVDPRLMECINEVLDIVAPVMKDHVKNFSGLTDAAGAPVSVDAVLDTAYYFPVAIHIAMEFVGTSNITEQQQGNSAGASAV